MITPWKIFPANLMIKRTVVAKSLSGCYRSQFLLEILEFVGELWILMKIYPKWCCFSTPANQLLFQKCAQANNKENMKAPNKWSFVKGIHRWLDCCVTKTSQPVASYIFLNTDGHIWTNLFITAYNNTDMTVLRKYITSQWRYVRDMASQKNSTVVNRRDKSDITAQHYWPFVRGIHRYLIIIIIIIIIIFIIITITIIFIAIIAIIITIIIIIFNYHQYFQLLLSLLLLSLLCAFVRRRRRATPYFFSTSWYLIRVT